MSAELAAVNIAADVTDEHRGCYLSVADPSAITGRRRFVLGKGFKSGVRRWTYAGVDYVGLCDDVTGPGVVGTEWMFRADAPCELLRRATRRRR